MPDSLLPPSWGPAPFDERDLDVVLSGETADIPLALRSVADTLAALRGAPSPAELSGEATIMAEFRALGLGEAGRPAGPAQTLELPALPADRSPRRAARHRARRRGVPSVSRRAGALMGVAAAVLIGVVVAFGSLPGPIRGFTHMGRTSTVSPSSAHPSGGNFPSPGLQATGAATTPDPTATRSQVVPSPTPSSQASRLCQELYGYHTHPESWGSWKSLYQQLSTLAGSSNFVRVSQYCRPYLGNMFHRGDSGTGSENSQSQGNGPGEYRPGQPEPEGRFRADGAGRHGPGERQFPGGRQFWVRPGEPRRRRTRPQSLRPAQPARSVSASTTAAQACSNAVR